MLELSATTKRKLLKLADFLKTKVQSKWFNLDYWATAGFAEKECGTTACAVGWATVCFPRSGLRLVDDDGDDDGWADDIDIKYTYRGEEFEGIDAAGKFFGIDDSTASYLFLPESYPEKRRGRKSVINRIREVVERGAPG